MISKAPWLSKTLWVNVLAIVGSVVIYSGLNVDPSAWAGISTSILALINVGLRLVTKEPIDWSGPTEGTT